MGNQLTVPSGSSWYLDDFNSNHLKNAESIFDGTFNLSFRAEENKEYVAVKAIQLSGKDGRSIAQTFYNIYDDKSRIISKTKSGNLISTPILTKNAAYLKRPFIDMPITERIVIDPPLELFEKKWIAFQLLHAIRKLHKITIFHGDIKPENILVDPNLNIYITDHAPFKPQFISQNQPHYFIHFFSYGRPAAYIAPERISKDLSTNPELQKEQTNRAILAIQSITESLNVKFYNNTSLNSQETESGQISSENLTNSTKASPTEISHPGDSYDPNKSLEALHFMQAADLFSIGCVLAFIFTGGKSLFDFTSLVQYGMSGDDSPLKILNQITDEPMHKLILELIDRDQKKRIEAINRFEESFPPWMSELYQFYIDGIIDTPMEELPLIFSSNKVKHLFPPSIHDEILIYLNIVSDFFSRQMEISALSSLIDHFEQFSLNIESTKLKVVRLIPPLLFLFQRKAPTISTQALHSILKIVRSIESIDGEEEIVKSFCDVFFVPQLISVMDPKQRYQSNEKIIIISHIPIILAEFSRLWPSILEKLPMRTEFIIPMLQYGGNAPVDETKLMIVRYFIASSRNVTGTKSYPVFKALYRILFQLLNCPVYVPLIVEFVRSFLKELNHVDKIRFYSELFAPFQGAVLSYASNFTKSENADDILVIFDAFATMVESGEIKITSYSAIANAAYKHVTSFSPSSRMAARVLLKKLPKIYQELEILPIVAPKQPQVSQNRPLQLPMSNPPHATLISKSTPIQSKSQKAARNTISLSACQKKRTKKSGATAPLIEDTSNANTSGEVSVNESNEINNNSNSVSGSNLTAPSITNSSAHGSNENLSGFSTSSNSTPNLNNSSANLGINFTTMNSSLNNANSTSENDVNSLHTVSSSPALQHQQQQSKLNESNTSLRSASSSRNFYYQQQQQQHNQYIKTQLFSSTKIASSRIQKILIFQDDQDESIQAIIHHSKSTVVCYSLNVNHTNTSNSFRYNSSQNPDTKIIEQSWIYTYPQPALNIDLFKYKNESGLIITFPDLVVKRTKLKSEKIYQTTIPFTACKMINGSTIAFSNSDSVFCHDISHGFALKGSYQIEKDAQVKGIYSWESMNDDFFAITTTNGRLHAIDQRTNVPIFTTAEYKGMSHVALLPHFAYAIVRGNDDLQLYRYSSLFQAEDKQSRTVTGGYSPSPIYEIRGSIDSIMSISNSVFILNQYGTFMLDNMGDCFSISDKNRSVKLNIDNNVQNNFLNRQLSAASYNINNTAPSGNQSEANLPVRGRSNTLREFNKSNLPKNDSNFFTPVVTLPSVNRLSLHGHTFPVTTCANFNNGAICMSGDCAGYLNVWSAIHPRSEIV